MKNKILLILLIGGFIALNIYLFVSAPPPLTSKVNEAKPSFSVEEAFKMLAKENDLTRKLYTQCIVGEGKKQGLQFDENWQKDEVEAGPLPALFLRETSNHIEKSGAGLGLYLGSDFPISKANKFSGLQNEHFQQLKKDGQPKFFFDASVSRYTAMFPDYASVNTCVSCHNNHEQSPKKDWKLNDMMGATTWTYPNDSLTTDELLKLIKIYKESVKATYTSYITELRNIKKQKAPVIGTRWPSHGVYIPDTEVFIDSLTTITAKEFVDQLTRRYAVIK
jgi:adenylate cyclase